MNTIPNPLEEPIDLSFIFEVPPEELFKVVIIGMVGMGLLIQIIGKKVNKKIE